MASHCKLCKAAEIAQYRRDHPSPHQGPRQRSHEKNGEATRAAARAYYEAHKEERKAKMREYVATHKDELREKDREYRSRPEVIEHKREKNRQWRRDNPDKVRAAYHRKRAFRKAATHVAYTMRELFDRDAGRCWICGGKVSWERTYLDPITGEVDGLSKSIDHLTPMSREGEDVLENVALAHLRCNVSRGNRWEPGAGLRQRLAELFDEREFVNALPLE